MSTDFRIKWLLYTLKKNQEQGFNWFALIVVLFILGLLAVIVWPGFLSQSDQDKQAEAKKYVRAINNSQQAYYTENGKFITENTPAGWASLGLGIKTQTANYKYLISSNGKDGVNAFAIPLNKNLKGYTGAIGLFEAVPGVDKTSYTIVCEAKNAGAVPMIELSYNQINCFDSDNSKDVRKIIALLDESQTRLKSTPLVKPPTQQIASQDMATLVRDNTEFAIDLYKQISSQPNTENVFFAPYSISSALAMTSAGARGNTATQMNQVLSFSLPLTTLHPGFTQLNYQLTNAQEYQLSIANRLWAQNNFSLLPPFVKITDDFYGAKIESLNFANAWEATGKINNWVSDRTQNQINHLLNDCDVGKNTKLVLTNAIYFKGNWQEKFESKNTKNQPFTLASGKQEQVPLMYQLNHFSYAEFSNLQVLQMPYKGNKLSMVILLPAKPDGLPNLERNLTTANLEKWLSFSQQKEQQEEQEVAVWLPKLKFEQRFKLKDTLSQMGMADAFNEAGKADFSGITKQTNLHIGDVIHKAFIEVDESGSKAAAATAVTMCDGRPCPAAASIPPMPKLFRADRPFLFLIKDQQSGSILFMGRFANPNPNSIK